MTKRKKRNGDMNKKYKKYKYKMNVITSVCPNCFGKKIYSIDGINWECSECYHKVSLYSKKTKHKKWV